MKPWITCGLASFVCFFLPIALTKNSLLAESDLYAGAAKIEVTDRDAGPVHDPSFARALVLRKGTTSTVLIAIDAVAIGEIGRLGNRFLGSLRDKMKSELGIPPENVLVNASHCHSIPRLDSDVLAFQAVKEAWNNMVPVKVGVGTGREDRVSENRRLKLRDGSEVDMRRAYSLPRDSDVSGVGPIDPDLGVLRIDRLDGRTLAIVYNFACHPIMNPPNKGNSADMTGIVSNVIEETLGNESIALFVQGCAGDINPIRYKEVARTPDADPLGNMLGVSVLRTARKIEMVSNAPLAVSHSMLKIPRGTDLARRIAAIESEQSRLLSRLRPTNIQFKSFLSLYLQDKLSPEFPSHSKQAYMHDQSLGRSDIEKLDSDNRASVAAYLENIADMEQLTRLNTNLALLKKHHAQNIAAPDSTIDAEMVGWRVGDFKLVTFPGELTVQIGLNIKKAVELPHAFVAGYTNGYLYYLPTSEQRLNTGYAQEDCDCIVAPEWQAAFEKQAIEVLRKL